MIRNVVLVKLKAGQDGAAVAEIQEGLRNLDCPGTLGYTVGDDLALREGNWSFAIVADFADEDSYRAYDQDAEHNRIRSRLVPMAEQVARVQFQVPLSGWAKGFAVGARLKSVKYSDPGGSARIPRSHVAELACFFAAHDRWLFGHACVRTQGDRELAADLVQDTFEAAARAWAVVREHASGRQRAWLLSTLAHKDISDFRRKEAFRRRQPDIQARYQATAADTATQALNAVALARAREIIDDLPSRQKQIALMRWQDRMRAAEIAAELGLAEGTVHAHLHSARRKLIAGLEQYYPFGEEGAAS
jgi:RNA polymerase sigma factor (sigma-70 family)